MSAFGPFFGRITHRARAGRSAGTKLPLRWRRLLCEPLEERALLSATAAADECAGWLSCNSSSGLIQVDVSCPAYTLELQASGDYQLRSSSLASTTQGGAPDLPGRLLRIALPMDADLDSVSLQVGSSSSTTLAGSFALTPAAVAATETEDGEVLVASHAALDADGRDVTIYSTNASYDAEWCTLLSTQQMGRWKIAEVYYSPFAYNPVTGQLEVMEEASFSLSYSGSDAVPAALAASTVWDADAEELVVNTADATEWYTAAAASGDAATSTSPGYAIITTAAIESNSAQLANFVAAKEAAGFTVTVATESDWGGGTGNTAADRIRSWLQANYATLGLEYVLLIGDPTPTTGNVPMKMTYPRSSETDYRESPTDYYYADLTSDWDRNDNGLYGEWWTDIASKPLHEVIVGRISVYGTAYSTLDSILNKTIAYGSETDISWRENLLLPMAVSNYANEDGDGYERCDGVSLAEYIASDLADTNSYGTYRLYEKAGMSAVTSSCDAALTEANLLSAWTTNTYGIVDWWGHGSSTGAYRKYWMTDDGDGIPESSEMNWTAFITSADTTTLDDDHPSVVFQVSCTNGYPEYGNNLGYALLKNGAIATYSASRVSWYAVTSWSPGIGTSYGDNASYAYYGTKRLTSYAETETTGSALQWCRENLGAGFGAESWMNCVDFNLQGDPSLTPLVATSNRAPVLDNSGAMSLTSISEDAVVNTGTLVSTIIASAGGDRITDADAGAVEGIAVKAVDNTNGTWQYSTNGGLSWSDFGSPSNSAARLLAADATTRIRFVPDANWNGTVEDGITFRAWDQTSGTSGGTADTSCNGGDTAFSTAVATASITVAAVNDAPTGLTLDHTTVSDVQVSGSVVGQFSTTDPDVGDTFVYTLVDNAGGLFAIEGDCLVVDDASLLDSETANYTVVARATDAGGLGFEKEITISVFHVDGVDSVAVFDPSTSTFYLLDENADGSADFSFVFGTPDADWETLVGDWDGNGTSGVGLYDSSTSTFFLTSAYESASAEYAFGYGMPDGGWIPLVGDWDGNGTAGVGLYDPSTSTFFLTNALATGMAEYTFGYGVPDGGWQPLVGDWDGNGTAGVGLYDPNTSTFYLTNALATGVAEYTFGYGVPDGGWQPIVGDWNGNESTGVGLYDPSNSTFYLTDTLATGYAEITFGYGVPDGGWEPLVGDWNGDGAAGVGLYDAGGTTFYLSNALTTGSAEYEVQVAEATAGCVPLVGCWVETPTPIGVDAVDLAGLAAEALGCPLGSSAGNLGTLAHSLA